MNAQQSKCKLINKPKLTYMSEHNKQILIRGLFMTDDPNALILDCYDKIQ